jgi:hypothetical protein
MLFRSFAGYIKVRPHMNRPVLAAALDLALGFGAAALFVLLYGVVLRSAWPYVFGAEWPSLGADASRALLRARVIDALLGVGFGSLLAIAAGRGWMRQPRAGSLMIAAGIMLHAVLDAFGSWSVTSALLETPLPWTIAALVVISSVLGRKTQIARDEV